MIAKFAKKINEILIQKEIVQKEDAELYQYGIENGIVVAGNLLASGIFGIVTGRPGLVLVFLLFYASLRSYSGGSHCKSRIGCFLISMAILFIPVYTYEPAMKNVPNAVILLIGVLAVVIIIVLAPVLRYSFHREAPPGSPAVFPFLPGKTHLPAVSPAAVKATM